VEFDLHTLETALAAATPLAGRGRARVVSPDRVAQAERILQRWRGQSPFHKPGWFERRLAADCLDVQAALDLLAEPVEALADRLGGPGEWADRLVAAFRAGSTPPAIPPGHDFSVVAGPLLADARDRLVAAFADLGTTALGDPSEASARLLPALTGRVHLLAQRTMILELNVARVSDLLTADSSEGRYRQFIDRLADPAVAAGLFAEYPVLARLVSVAVDQWVATSTELVRRLTADLPDLAVLFGAGGELGPVAELTTGLGDPHRGGTTVTRLTFTSGVRIVYKPRSIDVDVHYQDLLRWLNGHLQWPLYELACLPRPEYGWVGHVEQRYCQDRDELRRFYHRAGALLAVLYLLEATDCHAQNLIAVGDQPVLIDHETLLQPRPRTSTDETSAAERLAGEAITGSVLRPGMLPYRAWVEAGNGGTDLSALGWNPSRLPPREAPVVVDDGTDRIRVGYRRVGVDNVASRPLPIDHPLRLADYLIDIEAGFGEAYQALAGHRDEVRVLLEAFRTDQTRVLCRETLEYHSLLVSGLHPDLLRDGLARDRHLDRLWDLVTQLAWTEAMIDTERADLWGNDIPVFTACPGGTDLFGSTGRRLPAIADRAALDVALDKLADLGPADLDRQRLLLRWAVTSASADHVIVGEQRRPDDKPSETVPDDLKRQALDWAVRTGERLVWAAYRADDSLAWAGPGLLPGGAWALAPLGPDLYTGTSGVTLFLQTLARITGDAQHRAAADAAGTTLRAQLDRLPRNLGGGLCGYGGILYAMAHLQAAQPDARLSALADKLADQVSENADDDTEYDVIGGAAGTIGGLAAWHAIRPTGPIRDALRRCADRLTDRAERQSVGVGWRVRSLADLANRPLAGFAHGASGFAWALTRAAALLGEQQYAAVATEALAYERSLLDSVAGNWPDLRTGIPLRGTFPVLWCHGAAGIGLSRVDLIETLDQPELHDDLSIALRTVAGAGPGTNLSLCHGDLGNLDLFLTAPRVLDLDAASRAREAGRLGLAGVLSRLADQGWMCGLADAGEHPSLLVGLAGIGYGLLRAAHPDTVPSVLALQPPAPLG
jgi:type 2 lantibiotic biosynthesis protein LanM